jgi:hypothetical protein
MKKSKKQVTEWIIFLILFSFLFVSIFLVKDYGMNIDSQKNFLEGEMNLNYLFTGQVDQIILKWQTHGSPIFMVADAAKRLLSDRLNLYDPVPARHIILPFLTSFFMVFLFLFVKRHFSSLHGVIAVGLLLTFPAFWGDTFNNLKDVPLLIFFSSAIMSFVDWTFSGRKEYFYGFFILWGFSLAIKTYAIFVPVLLFLWMMLKPGNSDSSKKFSSPGKMIMHILAGFLISITIALVFYAPAFWAVEEKLSFLAFWHDRIREITWGINSPFNLIPFSQVFFRTPTVVLIFSVVGIVSALKNNQKSVHYPLFLIWFFIPILIPCLPHTVIYHNGLRLFFVFLVPFSLLATIGLVHVSSYIARMIRANEKALVSGLAFFTIGINLWGIVTTHPYQTTFFNALAGGLKGAQEKNIADACDYWLNSYKEAGRWINNYGALDAKVFAVYYSGSPPMFNTGLIKDAIHRADMRLFRLPTIPIQEDKITIPENTYVIIVPYGYLHSGRRLLTRSGEFHEVYRISRQGGEICTIYYKPRNSL